jgi:hypothetical protein
MGTSLLPISEETEESDMSDDSDTSIRRRLQQSEHLHSSISGRINPLANLENSLDLDITLVESSSSHDSAYSGLADAQDSDSYESCTAIVSPPTPPVKLLSPSAPIKRTSMLPIFKGLPRKFAPLPLVRTKSRACSLLSPPAKQRPGILKPSSPQHSPSVYGKSASQTAPLNIVKKKQKRVSFAIPEKSEVAPQRRISRFFS